MVSIEEQSRIPLGCSNYEEYLGTEQIRFTDCVRRSGLLFVIFSASLKIVYKHHRQVGLYEVKAAVCKPIPVELLGLGQRRIIGVSCGNLFLA